MKLAAQNLIKPVGDMRLLQCLIYVIRKALAQKVDPVCDLAVGLGLLERLTWILRNVPDNAVLVEAVWTLANIAAGAKSEYVREMRRLGTQHVLVGLLQSPDLAVKEHVCNVKMIS